MPDPQKLRNYVQDIENAVRAIKTECFPPTDEEYIKSHPGQQAIDRIFEAEQRRGNPCPAAFWNFWNWLDPDYSMGGQKFGYPGDEKWVLKTMVPREFSRMIRYAAWFYLYEKTAPGGMYGFESVVSGYSKKIRKYDMVYNVKTGESDKKVMTSEWATVERKVREWGLWLKAKDRKMYDALAKALKEG